MIRTFMIAAASATVLSLSPTAFAQSTGQYGNADEAKAMLRKAITAVKADKTKALDMFIKGEGGFLDRDLYPLCFNISDGKILAVSNPNAKQFLGKDIGGSAGKQPERYPMTVNCVGQTVHDFIQCPVAAAGDYQLTALGGRA